MSVAYTEDNGKSWIKLPLGQNPILCAHFPYNALEISIDKAIDEWPLSNLTGFRDPYAFLSPELSVLVGNSTAATGDYFLTISSGIKTSADPSGGPRLWLYRQTTPGDIRGWTLLGPLVSVAAKSTFSHDGWSGNFGVNFETACVVRLNENGESLDTADTSAVNFIGFGTEGGRDESHEEHWALCDYCFTLFRQNRFISNTVFLQGHRQHTLLQKMAVSVLQ